MIKLQRYEYNCLGYVCTDEDVSELEANYEQMLFAVEEFVEHFDSDTVERLFFINKAKAYRLGSALEQIRAAIAKAKEVQP